MIRLRINILIILFFIFFISCKKDEKTISQKEDDHYHIYPPEDTSCKLITEVNSLDTNYIPHKKNNIWEYCSGYTVIAPKHGKVVYDTIIQNVTFFNITFTSPDSSVSWTDKYFIDSSGSYYCKSPLSNYSDTLLLIDPQASNGDTIYNNPATYIKVILINKNETVQSFSNCYHVSIINTNDPNFYAVHYYYKKGIGSLFYKGTLKSVYVN